MGYSYKAQYTWFFSFWCHTGYQELVLLVGYALHSFFRIKQVIYTSKIFIYINENRLEFAIKYKIHVGWAKEWQILNTAQAASAPQIRNGGMGLSITGTKAIQVQVLIGQITEHFTNFPRLKEDPWFLPLFEHAPRGRKRAMPDRDATGLEPPTQRPCFDSETLPIEIFTQITQLEYPIASSSRIQLPFQPVPSSYFNTFSLESSHYHAW